MHVNQILSVLIEIHCLHTEAKLQKNKKDQSSINMRTQSYYTKKLHLQDSAVTYLYTTKTVVTPESPIHNSFHWICVLLKKRPHLKPLMLLYRSPTPPPWRPSLKAPFFSQVTIQPLFRLLAHLLWPQLRKPMCML